MNYVFTYWEGEQYPFTELCINSITNIFGDRHVHLTPSSIKQWVHLDIETIESEHILYRSDFIRALLLQKYGGWWFDSDILLFKNPEIIINDKRPKIWNLIYWYNEKWTPLINCGILYSPKNSTWINQIVEEFKKINPIGLKMTIENEDIGQDIFEKHSVTTELCEIGNEYDFNSTYNVNANYKPFWNGKINLYSANYGLHIGASLSRWAAKDGDLIALNTLKKRELSQLIQEFPKSVVAQYLLSKPK
jgi:hypothetical protein